MAADNDVRLISKVVRDGIINPVLLRGIDDSYFPVPESKAVWSFVKGFYDKYTTVPTSVTLKANFPNFRLLAVADPLEYLADQMVEYHQRQELVHLVQDAANALQADPHPAPALQVLTSGLGKVISTSITHNDLDLIDNPLDRLAAYRAFQARPGGLLGIPTGFPTIDKATSGLQAEQLVTIIAPPKTGKSTLALAIAIHAHEQGEIPMFQSFEMSNIEQQSRYDAMRAHISHSRLTNGALSRQEEAQYEAMLRTTDQMTHPFILPDTSSGMTVSTLTAKAEQLKPTLLVIDGVYLMTDEQTGESNTPQALTNITRSLKKTAQKLKIPVIITTQVLLWKMRRGQVSADSIGYSSSFFQDSDVILGLQKEEDDSGQSDLERTLKIVASRNTGTAEATLKWDWASGEFEELP